MKKILSMVLIIIISVLMLTGCGSKVDKPNETTTPEVTTAYEISENILELANEVIEITENVIAGKMDAKHAFDGYLKLEYYKAVTEHDEKVISDITIIKSEFSIYNSNEEEMLKSMLELLKYEISQ